MSDEIKVTVIRYADRENYLLAYTDPVSGKRKTRSAKTSVEKAAWKAAAAWEEELRAGPHCPPSKVTWADFRKRYEAEHATSLTEKAQGSIRYALGQVEKHLSPDRLIKVNASALSTLQTKLREGKVKEITDKDGKTRIVEIKIRDTTIANVLRHVKAALSWAVTVGLLRAVPKIIMPKGSKGRKMKGGALVGEQFDRMLAAVPKVRAKDAAEWVRYLTGLWLSGLRLGESIALSWDSDAPFAVDLSGRRPRYKIKGEAQKSGRDELTPMTPDFAEFLLRIPEGQRHGRVFKLHDLDTGAALGVHCVCKLVTSIGKKARVVVNAADGKTASAHDLRRTFGTRWAKRVMPAILRKLMRHANVQTTMQYYVDLDVDDMADDLWKDHPAVAVANPPVSNISSNIDPVSNVGLVEAEAVTYNGEPT